MNYEMHWNHRELELRCVGSAGKGDMGIKLSDVLNDRRLDEISDLIMDFSRCDGEFFERGLLKQFLGQVGDALTTNAQLRLAIVGKRSEQRQILGTCDNADACGCPVSVFDNVAQAREWLASTPLRSRHSKIMEFL